MSKFEIKEYPECKKNNPEQKGFNIDYGSGCIICLDCGWEACG